jgi:hypothetical protein
VKPIRAADRALPLLLIAAIAAAGTWIRFADLGEAQFSQDEGTHYFAARSLGEAGAPLLPSGQVYRRGIDLAYLMLAAQRATDDPELALRLPAAFFGALSLLVFAAVAWAMLGPWPAVWALLLFAVHPESILQARNGRFYTYQLCFVLPGLYALWRALCACTERAGAQAWLWTGASAACLLLAARVQIVTLSVALGAGAALACAAAVVVRSERSLWRANPALQICAAGAALAAIALAARPGGTAEMWSTAFYVPLWAGGVPGDPRAYHWYLADAFPLFYALAPASFALALGRDWRLGVLLGCWFALPFAIHSAVLPWKGERFLLAALPGLFLASGVAAAWLCGALRRGAAARLEGVGLSAGIARAGAAALVAGVSLFAVAVTPAFNTARRVPPAAENFDWRAAGAEIARARGDRALPVGSSMPLPALFYFGALDFTVGTDFLEEEVGGGQVRARAPGALDTYSGRPVLSTPQSIRSAFADAPAVLIAIDPLRLSYGNVDPELSSVLEREAEELCADRCRGLRLYRWALR